ncbi:MAG: Yip1 family protein [Acidobacteriota bacterium]|jgi:hypothetical protein
MDEDRNDGMESTHQEGGATPPPPTGGEPTAEKPPNPFAALGGVVASPTKAFAGLGNAKWTWLILPLLILMLLGAGSHFLYSTRADMGTVMRRQLAKSSFASRMTDQQIEQAVERAEKASTAQKAIHAAIIAPVVILWLLFVSILYWLVFMAMGQTPRYLQTAQVIIWSQVPVMIKGAITCIVFGLTNPTHLVEQNPIASNLGNIIGMSHLPGWAYALLSNIDIFQFWMMALYIIGFSVVLKVEKKRVAYVIIGIFLVKVILTTGMGFFFMK